VRQHHCALRVAIRLATTLALISTAVSVLGGIGFTMSIFIAELGFANADSTSKIVLVI